MCLAEGYLKNPTLANPLVKKVHKTQDSKTHFLGKFLRFRRIVADLDRPSESRDFPK